MRTLKVLALLSLSAAPAVAASSTSTGQISVTQVINLIERSSTDNAARNAVMAYLAGVGEATSLLVAESARRLEGGLVCRSTLGISSEAALIALSATASAQRQETPATPLLVADMFARAGCN
ncbi:hypothetical protein SAMN06295905_0029 [Devosia lucknowensis]|uniref:Chlorophyllide reductase n=1 Tax=Devosia lucknowensis TaxID=1096929 RepID=A0A1Y6E5W1_9HYPH|nr:chlorophyllide reductase [Devosia lucknowensis]SMQ58135.1 hypothetical protein SAMN06295905_0029 [Devosia lucknowensis]